MTKRADSLVKGDVLLTPRPSRIAFVHRWAYGVMVRTDDGAWFDYDEARTVRVA